MTRVTIEQLRKLRADALVFDTHADRVVRQLIEEIFELHHDLRRAHCGCTQRDCLRHGSWVAEDVEHVRSILDARSE